MEAANKALKRKCADLLCIFSTDRFVVAQYILVVRHSNAFIFTPFFIEKYYLKHKQVAFLRD